MILSDPFDDARVSTATEFESLFDHSPYPAWVYDVETLRFLAVNEAALHLTGYSRDEFMACTLLDMQPGPEDSAAEARIRASIATTEDIRYTTMNGWRRHHLSRAEETRFVELFSRAIAFRGRAARLVTAQDVTGRHHAEREREELLRGIREMTTNAQCLLWSATVERNETGEFLWDIRVSDDEAAERFLPVNRPEGQPFSTAWYESRVEADRERSDAFAQRELLAGRSFSQEFRCRLHHGEIRWLKEDVRVETVEDGKRWRAIGVCTDITDRKNAEEAMREYQETLRYITSSARCLLWYADLESVGENGPIRWTMTEPAPESAVRFMPIAMRPDEPFFDAWYRSRLDEDKLATNRLANEQIRQGNSFDREFRYRTATGEVRWIQESVTIETREAGKRWRAVGVCLDITDRKNAEAERTRAASLLAASEDRYHRVIDSLGAALYETDADGRLVYAAPRIQELMALPPGSVMDSARWTELVREVIMRGPASGLTAAEAMARARAGSLRQWNADYRVVVPPDGTTRWVADDAILLFDNKDRYTGSMGILQEVTERKRLQAQLHQTEKMLALGELVSGIAHEINNPLAVVSGNAQLLQMHSDPQVRADAAAIRTMAERASRIVRSLIAFAREQGDVTHREPCEVNAVVENSLDLVRTGLRQADVRLSVEMDSDLPSIRVNPSQIEQVIVNLLGNALCAVCERYPEGGADSLRWIGIRTRRGTRPGGGPGDAVAIEVSDNGPGIAAEIVGRIFDPFFTTHDTGGGAGLGLSICHGIVEAHQGTITVDTEPGSGATFTVLLPAGIPPPP